MFITIKHVIWHNFDFIQFSNFTNDKLLRMSDSSSKFCFVVLNCDKCFCILVWCNYNRSIFISRMYKVGARFTYNRNFNCYGKDLAYTRMTFSSSSYHHIAICWTIPSNTQGVSTTTKHFLQGLQILTIILYSGKYNYIFELLDFV